MPRRLARGAESEWMTNDERRSAWGVAVVGLGTLVVPSDSSVNVAFPAIVHFFDLPIADIRWVAIVYMLAQTSLMLVFGRVGDMVGYRRLFLIGLAVSGFGLLGCAVARSYDFLLTARVVQGIGGGLLLSCGPALALGQQPEAMRARVLGYYTMFYSAGFVVGPAVAGPLIEHFGWQGVYWFRVPIAAVAFLVTWTLPASEAPVGRQRFDLTGAVLLALGLTFACLGLDRLHAATAAPLWPIGLGVMAVMVLWGFVRQERRVPQPIIAIHYFSRAELAIGVLVSLLVNLACFAILLLLPFQLARTANLAPPVIGLMLASAAVGMVVASPLAGLLARRAGSWTLAVAGCLAMTVGLGGVAATPSLAMLVAALLVQGFGQGLFQVAFLDIVITVLPADARGVAGSLGMLSRNVGVVAGASVLMLVFQMLLSGGFALAFRSTMLFAAILPIVGVVMLWFMRKTGKFAQSAA